MIEIKVVVESPEVTNALNNLARAIERWSATSAVDRRAPEQVSDLGGKDVHVDANPSQAVSAPAESAAAINPDAVSQETEKPVETASAPSPVNVPETAQDAPAKPVSMNDLAIAGARLVDAGKMDSVISLLKEFGVDSIPRLNADQYDAFAKRLRALGADI